MPVSPAVAIANRPRLKSRRSHAGGPLLATLALAALVAGCQSKPPATDMLATGAISQGEVQQAVADWGTRYRQNPRDKAAALNYAAALRRDQVEFVRLEYDIDAVVKKILAEPMLDDLLGSRLYEGR